MGGLTVEVTVWECLGFLGVQDLGFRVLGLGCIGFRVSGFWGVQGSGFRAVGVQGWGCLGGLGSRVARHV